MTRRAGPALFVLSFALVPWGLEACGVAGNVLEDEGPDEELVDGGWGFGGTMAMGYGGSKSTGGFAGLPAFGGTPTVPEGGIAAGGGPVVADPNADLRRSLAADLCSIPERFPCLTLNVSGASPRSTAEELKTLCRQKVESSQYTTFGDRCFGPWGANAMCALQRSDYCPCDGDAGLCTFAPETHDYGPACAETLAALNACALYKESEGQVYGNAGTYVWADGQTGCTVYGRAKNGVDLIEAKCQGPFNGVQACTCVVNGVPLFDNVQWLMALSDLFYADDCMNVATVLAAGQCADVLDCCYSSTDGGAVCECGSHPENAGYSSCEELAASLASVVVDHCPRYRP